MSKIYQGNFQSSYRLAQLFLDTSAAILQKKSEIVGKNFSSSENSIWSILLKYQEMDMQIKSVQSALSDLLTTSGPRGTFSRLSTMRGCISIIELLQFTIVVPFGQVEARLVLESVPSRCC